MKTPLLLIAEKKLAKILERANSYEGRFVIGSDVELTIRGTPGSVDPAGELLDGLPIVGTTREWLFQRTAFTVDGVEYFPEKGDLWLPSMESGRQHFEVVQFSETDRTYRESTQHFVLWRIFMQYLGKYDAA